jgi:hypothetical protein
MTKVVDANYRFIAAYQEVNVRIVQRQQALALYVTMVVSLLAAMLALKSTTGVQEIPVEWLLLGFPVASLCLALLNYKAERAISNLRAFLSTLEQLGDAHLVLPSYNTEARWAAGANHARRFHDWATTVLAVGGNALGFGAAWQIYPQHSHASVSFWLFSVALSIFSISVLLLTPMWSYRPNSAAVSD